MRLGEMFVWLKEQREIRCHNIHSKDGSALAVCLHANNAECALRKAVKKIIL